MDRLKKTVLFAGIGIVVFFLAGEIPGRLIRAKSNSVNYSLFYKKEVSIPLKKGQYVVVPHQSPLINHGQPCKLIKRVACAEGDTLISKEALFYCNNEPIGRAKPFSLEGVPLPYFQYKGVIPQGKIFICGDHKDSYDSRYFGFKEVDDVEAIGVPLF